LNQDYFLEQFILATFRVNALFISLNFRQFFTLNEALRLTAARAKTKQEPTYLTYFSQEFYMSTKSKFSLFRNAVPATMMAIAPHAFAGLDITNCRTTDNRFALRYTEVSFEAGKDYAFFDYFKLGRTEFWGGHGSMYGKGKITANTLKLDLSWTETGASVSSKVGLLEGKKVNGEWALEFTPWNNLTKSYEKNSTGKLEICRTRTI
jgi:hypothetical protein